MKEAHPVKSMSKASARMSGFEMAACAGVMLAMLLTAYSWMDMHWLGAPVRYAGRLLRAVLGV